MSLTNQLMPYIYGPFERKQQIKSNSHEIARRYRITRYNNLGRR